MHAPPHGFGEKLTPLAFLTLLNYVLHNLLATLENWSIKNMNICWKMDAPPPPGPQHVCQNNCTP